MRSKILTGDVRDVLHLQPANSFDGCLCDPPYHLTTGKKGGSGPASASLKSPAGRARITTGFMGKAWDGGDIAFRTETWAAVFRVLKPGAMLMAFGGTRTHHRLMCAIEDAGFEIRDCLMWLYGSGFPKSLDISKAIDKTAGVTEAAKLWGGYGTALKPAYEPIILAMKPCEGTFAENALKWGVAGLAIDAGRIGTFQNTTPDGFDRYNRKLNEQGYRPNEYQRGRPLREAQRNQQSDNQRNAFSKRLAGSRAIGTTNLGRWPANVILDEEAAAALDAQSGTLAAGNFPAVRNVSHFATAGHGATARGHVDMDSGGASRFFYCAKASKKERGEGNTHPTVKPIKLIEYLSKLILPPERDTPRRLLVPFAGSGSEIIGSRKAGWDEITGIELDKKYSAIATKRVNAA